jgi:hypothetical protein
MKKGFGILIVAILLPVLAFAQGLYTYSKVPGESVTFAWDGNPIEVGCGTQVVTLARGQSSYTCDGKTYPLVWTGDDVRIVGGKVGGDIVIALRYAFQGVSTAAPTTILIQGETKANQVALPLTFGTGVFRLKVRAIRTWDGTDTQSDFSNSDGPNATVDGVARPWVVEVKPVVCTSFTYSAWSPFVCPMNGVQTRTVLASLPAGCVGGVAPVLSQTCTYVPPAISWPGGLRLQ